VVLPKCFRGGDFAHVTRMSADITGKRDELAIEFDRYPHYISPTG
jgi:hypothetical protein